MKSACEPSGRGNGCSLALTPAPHLGRSATEDHVQSAPALAYLLRHTNTFAQSPDSDHLPVRNTRRCAAGYIRSAPVAILRLPRRTPRLTSHLPAPFDAGPSWRYGSATAEQGAAWNGEHLPPWISFLDFRSLVLSVMRSGHSPSLYLSFETLTTPLRLGPLGAASSMHSKHLLRIADPETQTGCRLRALSSCHPAGA